MSELSHTGIQLHDITIHEHTFLTECSQTVSENITYFKLKNKNTDTGTVPRSKVQAVTFRWTYIQP